MKKNTKTFDCVDMKRKAQESLLAEFEARRGEFATLADFLQGKAAESEWVSLTWARFQGKGA